MGYVVSTFYRAGAGRGWSELIQGPFWGGILILGGTLLPNRVGIFRSTLGAAQGISPRLFQSEYIRKLWTMKMDDMELDSKYVPALTAFHLPHTYKR